MMTGAAIKYVWKVSTHSIRYRILKVSVGYASKQATPGFNPFDPIQDTERRVPARDCNSASLVSTHSIRYRILKDRDQPRLCLASPKFQPIRSDTGY